MLAAAPAILPSEPVAAATVLPTVSLIVPVLNDAERLRHCLESIQANDYPRDRYEVLVVDNGSRDDSVRTAERMNAKVLSLPRLSVAAMRNRAAAASTTDVLAFVDADHEISPGWIRAATEILSAPSVGAVGAPYHPPEGATWVQHLYDSLRDHRTGTHEARWLGSGNLALRRDLFLAAGGFDTSLTTCEDVDLCQRLRRHGHSIVSDSRLHSVHYGDPRTIRQLFASELWRGRDNLTVSLRGPMTWRDVPSIAMPILMLLGLAAAAVAATVWQRVTPAAVWLICGVLIALPVFRALRLLGRTSTMQSRLFRVLLVAFTYEYARALALVVRKGHRRA